MQPLEVDMVMRIRVAALAILMMGMLAPQARSDTVYGPDQHPLVTRNFCVHWVTPAQVFVANNSLGDRRYNVTLSQVGVSFKRAGGLRLPVLAVGLGEADQSQERLRDKLALLASAGIALRTGDWDNGRFEPQWLLLYTYDVTSKRSGFTFGFGIGF